MKLKLTIVWYGRLQTEGGWIKPDGAPIIVETSNGQEWELALGPSEYFWNHLESAKGVGQLSVSLEKWTLSQFQAGERARVTLSAMPNTTFSPTQFDGVVNRGLDFCEVGDWGAPEALPGTVYGKVLGGIVKIQVQYTGPYMKPDSFPDMTFRQLPVMVESLERPLREAGVAGIVGRPTELVLDWTDFSLYNRIRRGIGLYWLADSLCKISAEFI